MLSVHGSCRGECCSLSRERIILSGLVGLKLGSLPIQTSLGFCYLTCVSDLALLEGNKHGEEHLILFFS